MVRKMTRHKKYSKGGHRTFRKHNSNNRHRKGGVTSSEQKRLTKKNKVRIRAMKDHSLYPTALSLEEVERKLKTPPRPYVPSPSPRPLSDKINLMTSSKTLNQKILLAAKKKHLYDNAPNNIKSILIKQSTRIPLSKDEKDKLEKYKSTHRN